MWASKQTREISDSGGHHSTLLENNVRRREWLQAAAVLALIWSAIAGPDPGVRFPSLMGLLAILSAVAVFREHRKAQALSWPTAWATVESIQINDSDPQRGPALLKIGIARDDSGNDVPSRSSGGPYFVEVSYSYSVDTVFYSGVMSIPTDVLAVAEELSAEFPVGSRLLVRYNPRRLDISRADRDLSLPAMTLAGTLRKVIILALLCGSVLLAAFWMTFAMKWHH